MVPHRLRSQGAKLSWPHWRSRNHDAYKLKVTLSAGQTARSWVDARIHRSEGGGCLAGSMARHTWKSILREFKPRGVVIRRDRDATCRLRGPRDTIENATVNRSSMTHALQIDLSRGRMLPSTMYRRARLIRAAGQLRSPCCCTHPGRKLGQTQSPYHRAQHLASAETDTLCNGVGFDAAHKPKPESDPLQYRVVDTSKGEGSDAKGPTLMISPKRTSRCRCRHGQGGPLPVNAARDGRRPMDGVLPTRKPGQAR